VAWHAQTAVVAHALKATRVARARGPRVAFSAGARTWQLREAASWRAVAMWLRRPNRQALVSEAVADKSTTTKFFSIMKLNHQKLN
jgi:hypothetical protein